MWSVRGRGTMRKSSRRGVRASESLKVEEPNHRRVKHSMVDT